MYKNLQSIHGPVKTFEKYISKLHPHKIALWQRPCENHLSNNENICNRMEVQWAKKRPTTIEIVNVVWI